MDTAETVEAREEGVEKRIDDAWDGDGDESRVDGWDDDGEIPPDGAGEPYSREPAISALAPGSAGAGPLPAGTGLSAATSPSLVIIAEA